MANHTANILEVEHGDLEAIKEAIKGGKYEDTGTQIWFDFNRVIPMPKELEGTKAPAEVFPTQEEADAWNEERNRPLAGLGRAISQEESDRFIAEYGSDNWYDWTCKNWGTKWGAYNISEDGWCGNTLYFETAWSPPDPVIRRLSEMFPEATFTLKYADEGGGYLGYTEFVGGESGGDVYLDWDSEEGIALREELGRYWPEEESEDTCAECGDEFEVDSENEAHVEGYCSEKCMKASDDATPGDYEDREVCIESGDHLTSCDNDGYCNFCGHQGE